MFLNIYINRFFATVALLVSLCGCAKDDGAPDAPVVPPPAPQGNAVAFEPELSRAPISSFVTGDRLGVLAYLTDKDGNWNAQSKADLMYNTELTKTASGSFAYTPTVYYPANGDRVKFFAYYPYAARSGDNGITLSPQTLASYPTIDFDASKGSFNIDMLAAVTEAQSESSVTLSCQHLLTKINVSVKAPTDVSVTVTEIKISNINSVGRLSFDNYTNRPLNPETWWTNQGTPVMISETINVVADNTKYTPLFAEPKMVVPQSQNDVVIEISYHFAGEEATLLTKSYTQNVVWKAGDTLNYTIDIPSADDGGGTDPFG